MDKKSKVLIIIFLIIIAVSIFLTYKRAFLDRDFKITSSEKVSQ